MKSFYTCLVALFLLSCEHGKSQRAETGIEENDRILVSWRTDDFKNGSYSINYFTLDKQKNDDKNSFIYSRDSLYLSDKSTEDLNVLKDYIMTVSVSNTHDTLYLEDKSESDPSINVFLKYHIQDSIVEYINKKPSIILIYQSLRENNKETVCFSQQYGILCAFFEESMYEMSIEQHDNIEADNMKKLMPKLREKCLNMDNTLDIN